MDHQQQHSNIQQRNYQHQGGYGGESHEQTTSHHPPQHYHYSNALPVWNSSAGHGKRARDSPTFSDGDTGMQSSFKRLKVMDDCSSTTDSLYSTMTNYSSIEPSRFDAMAPQLKDEYQYGAAASYHHHSNNHFQQPKPCQRQVTAESSMHREQQSAGQKSCEPSSAGYQTMNSMLGDLHLVRLQRAGGAQPTAQHPAPSMDHVPQQQSYEYGHPASRGTSHKKQVSLRTSSKLY